MVTELERASQLLDAAILSLSAGHAQEAYVHLHHAGTILDVLVVANHQNAQPAPVAVEEPRAMAMAA